MSLKIVLAVFVIVCCKEIFAEDECGNCDRSACEALGACPFGVVPDACGCCEVCTRGLGETCNFVPEGAEAPAAEAPVNGTCGDYLVCSEEGRCECDEEGAVCGSDGVTYASVCELLTKTAQEELTVLDRMPCRKGPVIKSAPKDSSRPVGSILVLDCEATGVPVPKISWELYRPDGSTIQLPNDDSLVAVQVRGGPEKNMVTGWVQIMKILPENVGIYTCVATNSEGEAKASAKVSFNKGKVPKKVE